MIAFLDNSYARAKGILGKQKIRGTAFAFIYPFAFARKFFTWFCPPLRILAFSDLDGSLVFDRVVAPWRFVDIPSTRLVIELHPEDRPLAAEIADEIRTEGVGNWLTRYGVNQTINGQGVGATSVDDPLSELLFALLESAVRDLRLALGKTAPENLVAAQDFMNWRSAASAYERGLALSAGAFLADIRENHLPWSLPPTVLRLANFVLNAERDHADELLAAAVAGVPWMPSSGTGSCFRCRAVGRYRQVIRDEALPTEVAWRLLRPENYVCLCRACVQTLTAANADRIYFVAAYTYWGVRFRALHRWYTAYRSGTLPSGWNKEQHPLWPAEYGGRTWRSGSGALEHCAPTFGIVDLVPEHARLVRKIRRVNRAKPLLQALERVLN